MRKSGQLDDPSPAQRNGLKIRGNPEIRRRRGISVLSTGQPGNAWLAKLEDAGIEETRNPITKLNGTMHDPMSYKIITEGARGRKVSGVFIFWVGWCPGSPDAKIVRNAAYLIECAVRNRRSRSH